MIILGIETSCDETAASVVKDGREILSHVVASSAEMHAKSGGIIPEQAARQQVKSIIPVIEEAIMRASEVGSWKWETGKRSAKLEKRKSHLPLQHQASHVSLLTSNNIDAIAVTVGPGLIGSLLVGVETAKTLAYVWNKPIVPVNHLVAHLYANWLENRETETRKLTPGTRQPKFPAIALVVSGGHTDMVLMKDHGKLEWLGGTRDDAAGEAFDKVARLLGLMYPGGPEIARMAQQHTQKKGDLDANALKPLQLPRPMIDEDNFDFSFSGFKTAVLREVERLKTVQQYNNTAIQQLSFEIQEAITDVLVEKTLRALKKYHTPTLLLAGGVAANKRLTEKFNLEIRNLKFEISFYVPPPRLCTDNASYIAAYAEYNYHPVPWKKIIANPGLTIMGEA